MKLENINTSTIEGKTEVMLLAASGRQVVQRTFPNENWIRQSRPEWNWGGTEYAIIYQEIGPGEIWLEVDPLGRIHGCNQDGTCRTGNVPVRYVREDLWVEGKP